MRGILNLHTLAAYASQTLGRTGELWTLEISQLAGGYVAAGVYRHDLVFRLAEQQFRTISVVQKFTSEREVRLMHLLAAMAAGEAIPLIIDSATHASVEDEQFAHWFIMPFYAGSILTFDDRIPTPIIESLARIHARFRPYAGQIDWLDRVNTAFFRRIFDAALASLAQAQAQQPDSIYAEAHRQLAWASELSVIYAALEALPVTLTHGDVHAGNIIRCLDGNAVLFDWGNARIAPAMLDIANMIAIDSSDWEHYLSTWERASGEAIDRDLARLGYYWATVMVNLHYLPFAVTHLPPKKAHDMVIRALDGIERIAALNMV